MNPAATMNTPAPAHPGSTIQVDVVLCLVCCDLIYSRARHDFHYCRCGHTFVDGGRDYLRCGWKGAPAPISFKAELFASSHTLHFDWNWRKDLYGWSAQLSDLPASALEVLRNHITPTVGSGPVSRTLLDSAPKRGVTVLKKRGLVRWTGTAWAVVSTLPFRLECLGRRRLRPKPTAAA